jgi:hypothetical protein
MKPHHHHVAASAEMPTSRQRLFGRYMLAVLADLIVLNLFAEYHPRVTIDGFSVSLITAVLLQLLLQATLSLEHAVAGWFADRNAVPWQILRYFSAWLILFGSKFVMLGAIERVLGDAVRFAGPMHGVVVFILVILAMVATEELFARIYRSLD